ncbi:hypothetical protein CYMTET_31609, partial [Cymbomonas tetramitiformis]
MLETEAEPEATRLRRSEGPRGRMVSVYATYFAPSEASKRWGKLRTKTKAMAAMRVIKKAPSAPETLAAHSSDENKTENAGLVKQESPPPSPSAKNMKAKHKQVKNRWAMVKQGVRGMFTTYMELLRKKSFRGWRAHVARLQGIPKRTRDRLRPCIHTLDTPPSDRTRKQVDVIMPYLQTVSCLQSLAEEDLMELSRCATLKHVPATTQLIDQGTPGFHFYILLHGKVVISKNVPVSEEDAEAQLTMDARTVAKRPRDKSESPTVSSGSSESPTKRRDEQPVVMKNVTESVRLPGEWVGDLVYKDWDAGVQVEDESLLINFEHKDYVQATTGREKARLQRLVDFLARLPLFRMALASEMYTFAQLLTKRNFIVGSTLLKQGAEINDIYFIMVGEVECFKKILSSPRPKLKRWALASVVMTPVTRAQSHHHRMSVACADNRIASVGFYGPGCILGDYSVVHHCAQPVTVVAASDVQALMLPSHKIMEGGPFLLNCLEARYQAAKGTLHGAAKTSSTEGLSECIETQDRVQHTLDAMHTLILKKEKAAAVSTPRDARPQQPSASVAEDTEEPAQGALSQDPTEPAQSALGRTHRGRHLADTRAHPNFAKSSFQRPQSSNTAERPPTRIQGGARCSSAGIHGMLNQLDDPDHGSLARFLHGIDAAHEKEGKDDNAAASAPKSWKTHAVTRLQLRSKINQSSK